MRWMMCVGLVGWLAWGGILSGEMNTWAATNTTPPTTTSRPTATKKTDTSEPKGTENGAEPFQKEKLNLDEGVGSKDEIKKLVPKKLKDKKRRKNPIWGRDLGLGGYAGSWGNMPFFGLRGAIPLSPYLAMRVSLSMFFTTQREPVISYSGVSIGFLVRMPSFLSFIRNYAVTRIDFWPLWNLLNTNPEVAKISEKPTLGLSVLVGMELFVAQSLSFMLEAGFSSGMIFGFDTIKKPFEAFGFIMQSGLQFYF